MSKLLFLGGGVWGSVVASRLSAFHKVDIWHYRPQLPVVGSRHKDLKLELSSNLRYFHQDLSSLNNYDYVFIALPTQTIASIIKDINIKEKFIILSKGINIEDFSMISELLAKQGINKVATLYGPTHAEEFLKFERSMLVCSSKDLDYAEEVKNLFNKVKFLRIFVDDNIEFAQMISSMKNIVAICYGIAEGLGLGINSKSAIISMAMLDIQSILSKLNISFQNFFLPHGIGDVICTCAKGRNYSFGYALANNLQLPSQVVEGKESLKAIIKYAEEVNLKFIIFNILDDILNNKIPVESITQVFDSNML